jgi:TIR domain/AAA ATPase domain
VAAVISEIHRADQSQPSAIIFESYAWADATEIARKIRASLQAAGFQVWLDRDYLKSGERDFWKPLQAALESCKLVVALLSPYSVRLTSDMANAEGISVCHNELILAVRMKKAVISVTVIECEPPLAINHYEPIDLTNWQSSPTAYQEGIEQILHWVREGLADRRRYRIFVDNLSQERLSFPEEQTAALGFVGRDWVMTRLDSWLASESRCLLVEAEPGSGKTALVAELLRRNPGDRILAYHFCNSQREETVDPRRFIRSLAAMLCGTVPAYRARLRSSEDLVRALKSDGRPSTMLWQGILEPLSATIMDGPRYIIVDALDEAVETAAPGGTSIPRLLSEAIPVFPQWLKLVVTSRPHDRVLPLFQSAEQCLLGASVGKQQEDLRNYLSSRLSAPKLKAALASSSATRDRAIATLAERSAGNFRYAEMVLDELSSGTLAADQIDRLPKSLAGLYHNRAEARFPDAQGYGDARLLLSILLAAREPLTRSQLASIGGLDSEGVLLPLLRKLSCFVVWEPDLGEGGVYKIAHKSIGDWLIAPPRGFDRFKVDLASGRERILAHCRGWEVHREPYSLRHLIAHLLEGGFRDEALALVRDGFFDKRSSYGNSGSDLDDTRGLTLALIEEGNDGAIIELAKTENVRQRDGVTAGLLAAKPSADSFVGRVVSELLRVR